MSVLSAPNSQLVWRELVHQRQRKSGGSGWGLMFVCGKPYDGYGISEQPRRRTGKMRESSKVASSSSFWDDMSRAGDVMEMEEIKDCEQLDQILLRAKELSQPVLIDWMAAWCRKCIYLKPKLEKLAAEYGGTKLKFYCIDVNKVPQALVKRGNISKMPTIQLWKDGEFKEEVIGGHKGWLVVDEVRAMIQKFV